MTPTRILFLSAALTTAAFLPGQAAWAGFQYTAPAPQQAVPAPQQYAAPQTDMGMAPMPIAPTAPVESQTLPPLTGNADADQMNRAMASQMPMPLSAQPAPTYRQLPPAPAASGGRLVINPYPMQQTATHDDGNGLALDQAIMEQSGQLRTIAAPGSNSPSDMIARGNVTSRYDRTDSTQAPRPAFQQPDAGDDGLTPLPGSGGTMPSYPQAMPVVPAPVSQAPVMPRPAIPQGYPNAPESSQYAQAVGFGRDLPLALALSQVLPPDYNFSFAKDVDAGATVSWQGGKPWNEVLQDMLRPMGMHAVISGKQVAIQKG